MNAIEWQQWININQIEQEMQMPIPAQLVIYHMSYMYVCISRYNAHLTQVAYSNIIG